MKSKVVLAAVGVALALPGSAGAANPGSDNTSSCGAYHGMFGLPAHGFLREFVPVFATSGQYKGGTVGDRASNKACHAPAEGG
jgi:hypothetical protein